MKPMRLLNHHRTGREALDETPRQEGLSAIETGLVLLVFVVFITLGLANASKILGQSSVAEEATNLANLSTSIRALRTGAGYGSNIFEDLVATKGIPSNMAVDVDNGKLSNRWSGDVTFSTSADDADFTITYEKVPTDECVRMVTTVKQGVLRSVGAGTSTSVNIVDVTTASARSGICGSGFAGTLTWSSAEV